MHKHIFRFVPHWSGYLIWFIFRLVWLQCTALDCGWIKCKTKMKASIFLFWVHQRIQLQRLWTERSFVCVDSLIFWGRTNSCFMRCQFIAKPYLIIALNYRSSASFAQRKHITIFLAVLSILKAGPKSHSSQSVHSHFMARIWFSSSLLAKSSFLMIPISFDRNDHLIDFNGTEQPINISFFSSSWRQRCTAHTTAKYKCKNQREAKKEVRNNFTASFKLTNISFGVQ